MNEYINLEAFNRYLAQMPPAGSEGDQVIEVPVIPRGEEPVPVTQTPSPDALASYGIQGVVITLMVYVGKPLLEKLYLLFSEGARAKHERQQKLEEAQMKQAELLENTKRDQRDFLETFVQQQQQQIFSELQTVMKAQREQLLIIERSITAQTDTLKELLKSPMKVYMDSSRYLDQVTPAKPPYPSSPIRPAKTQQQRQTYTPPNDEDLQF